MKSSKYLFLVLLFFSLSSCLIAQNETGYRQLNEQNFKRFRAWYDSTTSMYQTQFPIIRSIPPLSTSMPYEMLLSYIYTDSICRFGNPSDITAMIGNWTAMNDTLRYAGKFLYKMVDYNPVTFKQYQDQVTLLRGTPFKVFLEDLRRKVLGKYPDFINVSSEKKAVSSLLHSDYALKVKVVQIDSMISKFSGRYIYNVTARVLDTLKGRYFKQCNPNFNSTGISSGNYGSYICFQYSPGMYFGPSDADFPYKVKDSAFLVDRDSFGMKVDQDAVVFLYYDDKRVDHYYDYYDLSIDIGASYGALPIIDGQVRDVNHVWSDSTLVDYTVWRNSFITMRDKILNLQY